MTAVQFGDASALAATARMAALGRPSSSSRQTHPLDRTGEAQLASAAHYLTGQPIAALDWPKEIHR